MVEKLRQYVKPFSSDTGKWRIDRQTDRIAISITRVSVLTRDKNPDVVTEIAQKIRKRRDAHLSGRMIQRPSEEDDLSS